MYEATAGVVWARAGGDKVATELGFVTRVATDGTELKVTMGKLAFGTVLAESTCLGKGTTDLSLVELVFDARGQRKGR